MQGVSMNKRYTKSSFHKKTNKKNLDSARTHIDAELAAFLPFRPISNDPEHNKKVLTISILHTLPRLIDTYDVLNLFADNFYSDLAHTEDNDAALAFVLPILRKAFTRFKIPTYLKKNFALLQECFGLSELDTQILYMCYLIDGFERHLTRNFDYENTYICFAHCLSVSKVKIQNALAINSLLRHLKLIETTFNRFKLTDFAENLMSCSYTKQKIMMKIAIPCAKSTLNTQDFSYMQESIDLLLNVFSTMPHPSIYLYGESGVGKNAIASILAELSGKELWEICADDEAYNDKNTNFLLAQRMLNKQKHIVLMDECEDIFDNFSFMFSRKSQNKNILNRNLESVQVPSIFLSNSADIDPAFLRRFDVVLEIKAPPKDKKKAMLHDFIKHQKMRLSEHLITQIAHSSLSQGIFIRACDVAKATTKEHKANKQNIFEAHLLQILNEHLKLKNEPTLQPKSTETLPYDMNLINADISLSALCEQCKAAMQKDSALGIRILAYGAPGSGKSAFSKALAKALNKPLITKRASDIFSMWVGGSERNIAAIFKEASAQGAILVLDEADSFLQERANATRGFEISQVNEMLTQMEHFEGIFIATTNFIDNLDSAVMRRFDMKIAFKELDTQKLCQAFSLYAKYLGISDYLHFLDASMSKMSKLQNICLGDFALIARAARLSPITDSQNLYEKLLAESQLKANNTFSMGF